MTSSEVLKATPVVAAAGVDAVTRFWGMTPSEWFYVAATFYAIVQAFCLIYKTYKESKS